MAIKEFKGDGKYGWVTCLDEIRQNRGLIGLTDRIPAGLARQTAEEHVEATGHRVSFGRKDLPRLSSEAVRQAEALQEARLHRGTYKGWRPQRSTRS
jgi:hypothetical protein